MMNCWADFIRVYTQMIIRVKVLLFCLTLLQDEGVLLLKMASSYLVR